MIFSICLFLCNSQSWIAENIGVNEGLASPDIWSLHQDSRGLLWVGTVAGVSFYNGIDFTNYSHSEKGYRIGKVKTIFEDGESRIWLGSDQGLFYWESGSIREFRHIRLNINSLLFADNGVLWMGCENGIHSFDSKNLDSLLNGYLVIPRPLIDHDSLLGADQRITDIEIKPNGSLLFSTLYLLCEYDHKSLKIIWGVKAIKPDIQSIAVIDDNNYYWACDESNFYRFDNGEISKVLKGAYIASDIFRDDKSILLLSSDNLFLLEDNEVEKIAMESNVPEWFRKVIVDREDNIWIATFEGLIKFKESPILIFDSDNSDIPGEVYSLGENLNGELLIGGNRGRLWTHRDNSFFPFLSSALPIVKEAEVFDIYSISRNELWFGTGYQGIARYKEGTLQNFTSKDGLSDNSRYFFITDTEGNLWTGGDGGIDRIIYNKDESVQFKGYNFAFPDNTYASFYSAVQSPNGDLWLGGTHGLFTLHEGQLLPSNLENATLQSLHITDIKQDLSGKVWMSTMGEGIIKCSFNSENKLIVEKVISIANGLPTNVFLCLLIDQVGDIWVGSHKGICRIKNAKSDEEISLRFWDKQDGYPNVSYPNMTMFQSSDGMIWGGTTEGLFHINPTELQLNQFFPEVYINDVSIIDKVDNIVKRHKWIYSNDSSRTNEMFPHNKNSFKFSFGSSSLKKPSGIIYKYRLLGKEEKWEHTKSLQSVYYQSLPKGIYTFEVQASNEDGVWSKESTTFGFEIKPAWWTTWLFRALLTLSFLYIIRLSYFYIKKKLILQEYEKTIEYFTNSNYSSNSVQEILWDVARNVISRLDFEDCIVYILNETKESLVQNAAYGAKNPTGRVIQNPLKIDLGDGIVGRAANSRTPILVNDTARDSRYIVDLEQKGSELAVPIIHDGIVLGVIDSEHSKKNYFKKHHIVVLQKIAECCAHKIATAQANEAIADGEKALLSVQKEIAESKLTALQAQMNPHFIFNSLNSINWYIVKNRPDEASHYLTKFSKLVRLILDNSDKLTIPIGKELEALKLYLDLESMRFANKFDYKIQADASIDLDEIDIPPLILQPFVENSIWHGFMNKKDKGEILIQINQENGHLKCIIQDNGIGRKAASSYQSKSTQKHQSKGMKLTSDRIQLLHQDYLEGNIIRIIDIEDEFQKAVGTRVEIILPIEE